MAAKRVKEEAQEGPTVSTVIEAVHGLEGRILAMAKELGLAVPCTAEKTVYDGFCREWTPAYYLLKRKIFHVHNFKIGIWDSMFLGVRTVEPLAMASDLVPDKIKEIVENTRGGSAPRCSRYHWGHQRAWPALVSWSRSNGSSSWTAWRPSPLAGRPGR